MDTKQTYVSDADNRADDRLLPSALRETQRFMARRRFWGALLGAVLLVALAGPFYTLERMGLGTRILYWGGVGVFAGLVLTPLSMLARRLNAQGHVHWLIAATGAGVLGVLPVMAAVWVANWLGTGLGAFDGFWSLLPYVAAPVIGITIIVNALVVAGERDAARHRAEGIRATERAYDAPANTPHASVLFEKLHQELGRDIICIEAQDHYIEVTTPQGAERLLMRLGDAETDLATMEITQGLRVHRSWWANLAHVTAMNPLPRGGLELVMSNGRTVPVARAQREAVRNRLTLRE